MKSPHIRTSTNPLIPTKRRQLLLMEHYLALLCTHLDTGSDVITSERGARRKGGHEAVSGELE